MFQLGLRFKPEVSPAMKPGPMEQPASGHQRIACGEPCDVSLGAERRQGMIWNVSVVGAYCVLSTPLPAVGETARLTFTLPGDPAPITCQVRVRWQNAPSIFKGCGQTKMALPPGCGFEFTVLAASDAARIAERVHATVISAR
jgi:PilZ domain-containing protein